MSEANLRLLDPTGGNSPKKALLRVLERVGELHSVVIVARKLSGGRLESCVSVDRSYMDHIEALGMLEAAKGIIESPFVVQGGVGEEAEE